MKGHLQLYHAFIPDGNQVPASTSVETGNGTAGTASEPLNNSGVGAPQMTEPEPGWEMVDSVNDTAETGQAQVEQPARVFFLNYII